MLMMYIYLCRAAALSEALAKQHLFFTPQCLWKMKVEKQDYRSIDDHNVRLSAAAGCQSLTPFLLRSVSRYANARMRNNVAGVVLCPPHCWLTCHQTRFVTTLQKRSGSSANEYHDGLVLSNGEPDRAVRLAAHLPLDMPLAVYDAMHAFIGTANATYADPNTQLECSRRTSRDTASAAKRARSRKRGVGGGNGETVGFVSHSLFRA